MTVAPIGSLSDTKAEGVWRFMYCQVNCIGTNHARNPKASAIAELTQNYDVDGVLLCEVGIDWDYGRSSVQLKDYFDPHMERECRSTTAHNTHGPCVSRSQRGGTGILLTHTILEYARATTQDTRKLGRWTSWILSHNPLHRTRIVIAYCPGRHQQPKGPKTVYRQHMNYIYEQGHSTTPYQLFVDDLSQQLKRWRAQGDRILLFIDANEHILRGPIATRLRSDDIELHEAGHRFWDHGSEPHTYVDGSLPIDGIFATPDIDVTNFLGLSFHESVGDHRTMIVEITTSSAIGRFQGNIVRPTSRRLTMRQPQVVQAYNDEVDRQLKLHNVAARMEKLRLDVALSALPLPSHLSQQCERLHTQIGQIRKCAEKGCRKILKPALDYSPPVQFWYDRAHAYKVLLRIKSGEGRRIDISRAIRMAHRKKIPNPRTLTAEQCRDGLAACKLRQATLRRLAPSLRTQFIGERLASAIAAGDTQREQAIRTRMQIERNKKLWKRIKKATKPTSGRTCMEVQVMSGNTLTSYTSKAEIEGAIQAECCSRFHLAHDAPIAHTLLGQELRYLNNIDIAYAILTGTFEVPHYLDDATKLMLTEIGNLGQRVLDRNDTYTITLTGDDYTTYWNKLNENTSSSPSGIHIAHYKASAKRNDHADLFAAQMNLIIQSGVHPCRWGTALQVMLEKVAGVCLVDKLRSIQLYEADLNWFMKFIFNDMAMSRLQESGLLPEEHYSKKGSTAEDACFEKSLTLDISRQSRCPMALISVDAAQCYDRVNPILMSLIWLGLTNSPHAVIILLRVLQEMKIFTRTGFGNSETFFGGDANNPLCGLGQGSKAAPASWLQLSSMIVNAYKNEGRASSIQDPITGHTTESVGCLFVDDTDLYVMHPLIKLVISTVACAQLCVNTWSTLLAATGGAIKGQKSFWYLIAYVCTHGVWHYAPESSLVKQHLKLHSSDGSSTTLMRKGNHEAEKTLGVYHSPDGSGTAHLQYIRDRAITWVNQMKNAHLPSALVMISYHHQLWAALRYGLATLTNSFQQAEDCLTKLDHQLLPLLGVNRNITKGWRTLHYSFGGIGLLSLPTEQFICRLNMLLLHYNTRSIVGDKLTSSLHWLQLQLGCHDNPLLQDYNKWGHLATTSWVSRLWETLHKFASVTIFMKYPSIPLPRINDQPIMTFLGTLFTSQHQSLQINRCRCYLHLLFLSDITLADGKTIDPSMITRCPIPKTSSYTFPPEIPTRSDWIEWELIWRKALGRNHSLPVPLGQWIHDSHIRWVWFYNSSTETVTEHTDGGIRNYQRITSGSSTRRGMYFCESGLSAHPSAGTPVSCTRVRDSDSSKPARIFLKCMGPQRHISLKLPHSFWDDLLDLGGEWMWNSFSTDTDDSLDWLISAFVHGTLLWVTDGSYNATTAPDVSGSGWIAYDSCSSRRWACSFYEVSNSATSYRAELLGLYSIHIFIKTLVQHFALLSKHQAKVRCDNKNALRSSSRKNQRIRSTSKCADILRAFKTIHQEGSLWIHYGYVPAHLDDILSWDELTLEQQLNVRCDLLAKNAVARSTKRYHSPDGDATQVSQILPGETCAIFANGAKITSDPAPDIRFNTSLSTACAFLCTKRGWSSNQFNEVDWKALHSCLRSKSPGYRIWLSKQHSDFCATRVQMKRWFGNTDDRCPSCEIRAEKASHLCRCPNEERTMLLKDNTDELEQWMLSHDNTYHELAYLIPKYILCRGTVKFCDLGPMSPRMMTIALSQDTIGWRNFMEGRVSRHIYTLQRAHLLTSSSHLTAHNWMKHFISKVLHITHSQWLFRNFMLHDSAAGYLRLKERATLAVQIDSLMSAQSSSIPEECRFLLEFDVDRLLQSDTNMQHYWVSAMEAALSAKSNIISRSSASPSQQPSRKAWQSRWNASSVILQLRADNRSRIIPSTWVWTSSSVTHPSSHYCRPAHMAAQLHHKSNKKHKPD